MTDGLSYAEIFSRIKEIRKRQGVTVKLANFMPEEYKYQSKINGTTIAEYKANYGNNLKENIYIHKS